MIRLGLLNKTVFTLLFTAFAFTGCGTVKALYSDTYNRVMNPHIKKVKRVEDGLRKRVLLMPLMDHAGIGNEKALQITTGIMDKLKEDDQISIEKADLPSYLKNKTRSPQFGVIVDPDMARDAEEKGMNVLITSILYPHEISSRTWGFYPLLMVKREQTVSIVVNALDITNGTLLFSNQESEKIKLPSDEEEEIDKEEYDQDLNKALDEILERQASALKGVIGGLPWTGRVISAGNQGIMINAGRDVGLNSGLIFNVFERGEAITAANGRTYHILGAKVGELKAEKVMDNYSSAVSLTEVEIKPGQLVRVKIKD